MKPYIDRIPWREIAVKLRTNLRIRIRILSFSASEVPFSRYNLKVRQLPAKLRPNGNFTRLCSCLWGWLICCFLRQLLGGRKTITQRRLHSPTITTGIMKCIRKKHRWFRFLRNGLLSYNVYKVFVKKTPLIVKIGQGTIFS